MTHFKIIRFEHRPQGKWRQIRDLGLVGRNPGQKSTESVKKQANGHFLASLTAFAGDLADIQL